MVPQYRNCFFKNANNAAAQVQKYICILTCSEDNNQLGICRESPGSTVNGACLRPNSPGALSEEHLETWKKNAES